MGSVIKSLWGIFFRKYGLQVSRIDNESFAKVGKLKFFGNF